MVYKFFIRKSFVVMAVIAVAIVSGTVLAQNKKTSPSNVDGQVFIVTKGQQSIKLALVSVTAISEKEMDKYITGTTAKINDYREQKLVELKEYSEYVSKLHGDVKPTLGEVLALRTEIVERLKNRQEASDLQTKADAIDKQIKPLIDKWREERKKLNEMIKQYNRGSTPLDFFSAVETIPAIATAKTDTDGKFSLSIPASQNKIALVAKSSRKVMDKDEEYLWVIWAHPKKAAQIFLANDNLIETTCSECVRWSENLMSTVDNNSLKASN